MPRIVFVSRFYMDRARVKQLRYTHRDGHYAGRTVSYVRILDPASGPGSPTALFEGRPEKNAPPKLRDLRRTLLSS